MKPALVLNRILALMVDLAIFLIAFFLFFIIFNGRYIHITGNSGAGYSYYLAIDFIDILILAFSWLVFIILTEFKTGQSIGKRIFRIRVVKRNFFKAPFKDICIRHIFDFVDYFFIVGLIIINSNINKQRLGDIVAKTMVINSDTLKENIGVK